MLKSVAAALASVPLLFGGAAAAQSFPEKPVRMIVPYVPGGTTDTLARVVASEMSKSLGQNVLVENVGGAGGRIGTSQVAHGEPDGYLIVFSNNGPLAATLPVFNEQDYDPRKDVAPIGLVADVPMVLAVSKASGVTSLPAFVEKLKTDGEAVNIGTAGIGATSDLAPALFLNLTKLTATRVPYQGIAPAVLDLTAGVMDAVFDQTVTMIGVHEGQQATVIAVSGPARVPQLGDVPTFAEGGLPAFDMTVWNALAAPKGTPPEIVEKLAASLNAALDSELVKTRFAQLGVPIPPADKRGPAMLAKLIDSEVERWTKIFPTPVSSTKP